MKILVILLFWCIFVVTSVASRIYSKNIIPKIKSWSIFDHYPFICEKCFTTWFMASVYIMTGYLLNNYIFAILGVIVAIGNGIGTYLTEQERKQ